MGHKRPRSSSSSDSDLVAHVRELAELGRKPCSVPDTVPCLAPPSVTNRDQSHVYGEAEHRKYAEVEWMQFMAPEILQAQYMFRDRHLLINTMCSGIGGPAAALQAPVNHMFQHTRTHTGAQLTNQHRAFTLAQLITSQAQPSANSFDRR